VGLHATDPATPYLSRWARLPGVTVADLDAELYQHAGQAAGWDRSTLEDDPDRLLRSMRRS
jgi:hypothetical protein